MTQTQSVRAGPAASSESGGLPFTPGTLAAPGRRRFACQTEIWEASYVPRSSRMSRGENLAPRLRLGHRHFCRHKTHTGQRSSWQRSLMGHDLWQVGSDRNAHRWGRSNARRSGQLGTVLGLVFPSENPCGGDHRAAAQTQTGNVAGSQPL